MTRLSAGPLRRPFMRGAVPAALAVAVLAGGCGGSDEPSKARAASKPPARGRQRRAAGRDGSRSGATSTTAQTHGAIFTINPDGSDERQLTNPPGGYVDDHPDWSPDGKRIAFERCAEGKPCQVFTVDADGGSPQKVKARCELSQVCDLATRRGHPTGDCSSRSPRAANARSPR